MIINDFSSYFQLFAALNLAYASLEFFRREITNIFSINKLSKSLDLLQDKILSNISNPKGEKELLFYQDFLSRLTSTAFPNQKEYYTLLGLRKELDDIISDKNISDIELKDEVESLMLELEILIEEKDKENENEKIENLRSCAKVLDLKIIDKLSDEDTFASKMKVFRYNFDSEQEELFKSESSSRCFIDMFKPISLMLSIYCIVCLLIGGFQNSILDNSVLMKKYEICTFLFASFVSVFSFIIFFSSISKLILKFKFKLKPIYGCFSVFFFFIIAYFYAFIGALEPHLFKLIFILPSILFVIFLLMDVGYKEVINYLKKELNMKLIFVYVIVFSTIFYTTYKCFNSEDVFLKNLLFNVVILSIPVLLYFFLMVRVFIHRRKFKNKYGILEKTATDTFESILSVTNS